ncbi:MAG: VOC family protein [Pseudomonadota bacterium]
MTLGIALIKIPVDDLARSQPFYEALGLTFVFVSDEWGWAQSEGTSPPVALYVPGKGGGSGTPGGEIGIHFSHSDLEALAEQVGAAGGAAEIATNADGTRSLECRDPAGNLVRIMEAR